MPRNHLNHGRTGSDQSRTRTAHLLAQEKQASQGAIGHRPREEKTINEIATKVVFSVGVVGLGRIGSQLGTDDLAACTNYSKAARTTDATSLSLGVDPDAAQRRLFEALHGAPAMESVQEVQRQGLTPDIWIVACPTAQLVEVVSDVFRHFPKAHVLVEKPLAVTEQDIERCRRWPAERVKVGYTRRFIPESSQLREVIDSGCLGQLKSVRCVYSRGFANNASHLINLLQFLSGEVTIDHWTRRNVWSPLGDCSVDLVGSIRPRTVRAHEAKLLMYCVDEPTRTVAAMVMDFELGTIYYEDLGARVTIYSSHGEKTQLQTDLSNAPCQVVEQLAFWVSGKAARGCTLQEALNTSDLLRKIVEQ